MIIHCYLNKIVATILGEFIEAQSVIMKIELLQLIRSIP